MTQKITRKNLNILYTSDICDTWKKHIEKHLISQQLNKDIEVENDLILKAYGEANTIQKQALEKFFKIETPKNIIDRIKNLNDIFKLTGKKKENIIPWEKPANKEQISQNAVALLQVITEAYNQGAVLDFTNSNQSKYYIWWRKDSGSWAVSDVHVFAICAVGASGCYFAKRECAEDASKKFKDIFIDYLPL